MQISELFFDKTTTASFQIPYSQRHKSSEHRSHMVCDIDSILKQTIKKTLFVEDKFYS